jgi:hypothetical protein
MKYTKQVAPGRAQINPNDPNPKFDTAELVAGQTDDQPTAVPNSIFTDRPELAMKYEYGTGFGH